MPVRDFTDDAPGAWPAASEPGHVGCGAGLVEKDKLGGIKQRLVLPPLPARGRHVGPVLLGGVHGFF